MSVGRALLVAYSYPPDTAVGALRPARFAKYLPYFGYQVSVVTAARQPDGADEAMQYVADPQPWWQKRLWRIGIEPGLAWIRPAAATAVTLARKQPFVAIISTSPPLSAHLAAHLVQRRAGLKWVADFRDPICGDTPRRKRLSRLIDPALERFIFRHADALIANTDNAAGYWSKRYPQWQDKISVIWNGFDPDQPLPADHSPPRPYRLLVHTGDLYANRHPGPLLQAIERLIAGGKIDPAGLKVRLIGAPPEAAGDPARFRPLMDRGVVEFRPWVSRVEAAQALAEADSLLLLDVRTSTPMQVPSKLFDYIRARRPILAVTMPDSPAARILEASGIPHASLYWTDSAEQNAAKLLGFLSYSAQPAAPSPQFLQQFDARDHARELAGLLDRLHGLPAGG